MILYYLDLFYMVTVKIYIIHDSMSLYSWCEITVLIIHIYFIWLLSMYILVMIACRLISGMLYDSLLSISILYGYCQDIYYSR